MDDNKKALVTTIDTLVIEGTTDMVDKNEKTKPNVVEEAITPSISERKNIDTINKTEKSQASNNTVDRTKINKTDKFKSLDKSRYTQRNDTINTVDKST